MKWLACCWMRRGEEELSNEGRVKSAGENAGDGVDVLESRKSCAWYLYFPEESVRQAMEVIRRSKGHINSVIEK